MMTVSMILVGIYGGILFVSRKMSIPYPCRKWQRPFYKTAVFLQKIRGKKQSVHAEKRQAEALFSIWNISAEEYEAKKIAVTLMIGFLSVISSIILSVLFQKQAEIFSFLKRPSYGEHAKTEELDVKIEGTEDTYKIPVEVSPRQYSQQEAREKVESAMARLDEILPGNNVSLDEVETDLVMPKTMENGTVTVAWNVIPYGVVSEKGEILKDTGEEGEMIKIEAVVQCQGEKGIYEAFAMVIPGKKSDEEKIEQKLEKAVKEEEERAREEERVTLPEKMDGKRLTWSKDNISIAAVVCGIGSVLCAFFWIHPDQKLEKTAKKRQLQLKMDYAILLFKMRILLGAGMTIRSAFFRIASEYEEQEKKEIRYVYEEMVYSCREMKSGIPEEKAYEHFGQRCGQPRYLKLARILAQHMKKGTEGLEEILEQEMQQAQEERIALAKQTGEEAGTKLLIPMGMMLIVVLVILVLPAFLNL